MDVESMRPHSYSKTMKISVNFTPQNLRTGAKYRKLQESRISTLTFFLFLNKASLSVTKEAQFSAEL